MSEIKEPSLSHRIVAIIGGTASFVITVWIFFTLFAPVADANVAVVMSVISGVMVGWIVLSLSGVLKQFSLKSPFFEMSANIERKIEEVKNGNKKIESEVKSVNNRIDAVMSNQMNVSMSPSFNLINNLKEISQTEDEIQRTVSSVDENNKIPTGKLDPEKTFTISAQLQDKLNVLIKKQSELQNKLKNMDDFPLDVMKSLRNSNYYYSVQEYEKSIKILDRVLQEEPDNIDALQNMAYNYSDMKDHDKAIEFARRILKIDPNNRIALAAVSHDLIRSEQFTEAKKILDSLVKKYPDYALGWFNKACVESLENDHQKSISSLRKSIKLDSKYSKKPYSDDKDLQNIKHLKEFQDLMKD